MWIGRGHNSTHSTIPFSVVIVRLPNNFLGTRSVPGYPGLSSKGPGEHSHASLVTGDECPHVSGHAVHLSLRWVWLAWIRSWKPGHSSCTDNVSFGDYTAVKPHLSKMMDVITKGIEIPESQAGIPRYLATDSPSFHWPIFPEQQAFWKVVNFWAHPRTWVNKAVNPGKCPRAFTELWQDSHVPFVSGSLHRGEGRSWFQLKYSCLSVSFSGFIKCLSGFVSLKRIQG